MESTPAQALLYQLRSPTLALDKKLELAQSTLTSHPSILLSQLIRDWILLDLFLRTKDATVIVNLGWWSLLSQVVSGGGGAGSNTTSTLPIFVSFLSAYTSLSLTNEQLVSAVLSVWTKLSASAMRKATVDAALESYSVLLKTSVVVVTRGGDDLTAWEGLGEIWLSSFRLVVDSGKGGKKIPLNTLSNLNSILPLLSFLSTSSPFYTSILTTVQFSLFNLENLRRGIARESYNAGGVELKEEGSSTEAAEGELFNALSTCLSSGTVQQSQVFHSLPLLFNLYRSSLSLHSTSLFPLPIRSSFPTASAARSALEIHSLQKLRALAAGWIKGISALVNWSESSSEGKSLKATALWKTLQEVEIGDLFRTGLNSGWELVLEGLTDGSLKRLTATTSYEDREPLLGLVSTVLRLNFEAIESFLPTLLLTLSSTPSTSAPSQLHPSPALSSLLNSLLVYHTRSLLIPSLLSLLSIALSKETKAPNSLLDLEGSWKEGLGRSITGLGSRTAGDCAESLITALRTALEVGTSTEEGKGGEREGKRRKKDSAKAEKIVVLKSNVAATGRIQVLQLFFRFIPSPLPLGLFNSLNSTVISPYLATSSTDVVLTRSILGLRYAILERMAEEGESSTELIEDGSVAEKLLSLVKEGEEEVVLDTARNLLQALDIRESSLKVTSSQILSTILSRMLSSTSTSSKWDGHLQGIDSISLSVALWEMIARRWLSIFERFGDKEHLELLAKFLVECVTESEESEFKGITAQNVTARLLRRADFYEMRKIQAQVQIALLSQITIMSLTSPTEVLVSLSATKLPKPLRSLSSSAILKSISLFSQLSSLIPLEYLSKSLKSDLVDRALSLDIWISSGKVEGILIVGSQELRNAQEGLRKFVLMALPSGGTISNGSSIIGNLLESTQGYSKVTVNLYRHFVKSSITSFKSDKNIASLKSLTEAFDKPLSDLAKRSKKGIATQTCSELAFFTLCDTLVTGLGPFTLLIEPLQQLISSSIKTTSKSFAKVMTLTTVALQANPELVHDSSGIIDACRSFWGMKDWFTAKGDEDDYSELYSNFSQTVLSTLLSTTATSPVPSPQACLATLELLNFRMARLRSLSDSNKISTLPFETFVACHVTFRPLLQSFPKAIESLNESLKRATISATLKEYASALQDVSGLVASAAGPVDNSSPMEPALEVALGLLRDGPEGSSKLSSSCLSDLVRHISLYLVDQTSLTGASTAQSYLTVAKFIEGVCGDRPMLLSRQNVSSILSLVSRMLDPSTTPEESITPTPASLTSSLFLSLVSIVSHLIRHRKDHITPLFPHLVSTLTSFLTNLRRAGFGTTGSSSLAAVGATGGGAGGEDLEVGISLGKRAEREARLTFPFWVWEGGVLGMGKKEAKAVGRLLAGLTSKTTERTKKRKVPSSTLESTTATTPIEALNPLTTTSLSAPLSKHAPFIILPYLRACVHIISPIPSSLRMELQGGWFELMDSMGKWEREALMKGFLKDEEEAERGVLRGMWRSWEKERYRG